MSPARSACSSARCAARLYGVSYDGKTVTEYLDINAPGWNIGVQFQGNERGFQSFVFHPQFNRRGARGYGKFYTYLDTTNITPAPDFTPGEGAKRTHDTVLLEWTAKNPAAASYDGGAPKELFARRAAVREPQRRRDRVQSADARQQLRSSDCSTSASRMAAAAAIR